MTDNELIADWLHHASNDLISARHLFEDLRPRQTEIAAYHSQQCAEKALKAFLCANDIEFPKTHNLLKLFQLCAEIDGGFSEIEIECQRLNPYGTITRYPNELVLDETVVTAVIERARKIYEFCVSKVNIK
jgi:HEPN domain-containing protein